MTPLFHAWHVFTFHSPPLSLSPWLRVAPRHPEIVSDALEMEMDETETTHSELSGKLYINVETHTVLTLVEGAAKHVHAFKCIVQSDERLERFRAINDAPIETQTLEGWTMERPGNRSFSDAVNNAMQILGTAFEAPRVKHVGRPTMSVGDSPPNFGAVRALDREAAEQQAAREQLDNSNTPPQSMRSIGDFQFEVKSS